MPTVSSSPGQTSSLLTGITLVTNNAVYEQAGAAARSCERTSSGTATLCECTRRARYHLESQGERSDQEHLGKSSASQPHFAKYEPQQSSDVIGLGWDCGICLEMAEDPCVTRCGHLYCQSHLNQWLSTHPSCPVCKTLCTPAQDVVPIFSRGRTSPLLSSTPSLSTSLLPSDEVYHDLHAAPLIPRSHSGSLVPIALHSQWPDMTESECLMSDYDIIPEEQMPSTPPLPPVSPGLFRSPIQAHPHPLITSYIVAHYLGIALRILGVGILLGVLLS